MKKKYIWWIAAAIVLIIVIIVFSKRSQKTELELMAEVQEGDFEILVTVTGELQAMNSVRIEGPTRLRSGAFRLGDIKIQSLIAEGTVIDSGEIVAVLDRSAANNAIQDMEDVIEREQSEWINAQLDTTMTLQGLRDELVNKRYAVEEAEIKLEQSKFEPPATIRQAQIDLDKAKRSLEQALVTYDLKVKQSQANMTEADISLSRQLRRRTEMYSVLEEFTIKAPIKGMVIYYKEPSGQKRKPGSSITPFDLTVATLPDLSVMISKTYVNEIDFSKVKPGQKVRLGVDAFPEKKYTGEVLQVANTGEQLANTDAKVFEVTIRVNEYDPILRPLMTTSNTIVINLLPNQKYLPLEAIYSQDSIPFVYTKQGVKQVVVLGDNNENGVIVEQGLDKGDIVYISVPENPETWPLAGQELIPIIKEKALQKKREREEQERQARQTNVNGRSQGGRGQGSPGGQGGQGRRGQNGQATQSNPSTQEAAGAQETQR